MIDMIEKNFWNRAGNRLLERSRAYEEKGKFVRGFVSVLAYGVCVEIERAADFVDRYNTPLAKALRNPPDWGVVTDSGNLEEGFYLSAMEGVE